MQRSLIMRIPRPDDSMSPERNRVPAMSLFLVSEDVLSPSRCSSGFWPSMNQPG